MVLAQLVVEVLGGQSAVALAIQAQHLVDLIDRHPLGGRLAQPSIEQALEPLGVVALRQRRKLRSFMPRISAASAWLNRRWRQRP